MYVVHVVQSGSSRFSAVHGQKSRYSRCLSTEAISGREALSHGVIYVQPSVETPQVSLAWPVRAAVPPTVY